MGFLNWLFKRKPKRPKLGIALGSGGAKGFAELGALRAFEENGIEFDFIAGGQQYPVRPDAFSFESGCIPDAGRQGYGYCKIHNQKRCCDLF